MTNPLHKILSPEMRAALGASAQRGRFSAVVILTSQAVAALTRGEAYMLTLETGDVIILAPDVAVTAAYGPQDQPQAPGGGG